jgi:UDP-GlcNAc:undecaprenyl-phosphate GlcNAc-1-phosphate transferase
MVSPGFFKSELALGDVVAALAAAGLAWTLTTLFVPMIRRVALAVRAVDYPGGRRPHDRAVPRLGGVAIASSIALTAGVMVIFEQTQHGAAIPRAELLSWVLACTLVFAVGLVEDLIGVSAVKRFLVEVVAAWVIVQIGWSFSAIGLPFVGVVHLGWLGPVVTIAWIVGVTNAINLIDGLDGLAGGVIAIISVTMMVMAALDGNTLSFLLLAAVFGACLGFLRHNWAPAKIFMGDAGSLTLGFILGTLSVHNSMKTSAAVAILVPLLALGVPVIDTLLVMLVRFLMSSDAGMVRRVSRMFRADRSHLHHLAQHLWSRRDSAVRLIWALVLATCLGAIVVALTKSSQLGVALVVFEVAMILVIRRLGFSRQAAELSESRSRELIGEIRVEKPSAAVGSS